MYILIKRIPVILFIFFNPIILLAQTDTIVTIQYDTVIVRKPPVTIKRQVLYVPEKSKIENQILAGLSAGVNYFSPIYYTCKECSNYQPYARMISQSQPARLGVNISGSFYKNISNVFFYKAGLRYSLYSEKFNYENTEESNRYQLLRLSSSIAYKINSSPRSHLFVEAGANLSYLLSASGKTISIFQETEDMNQYRRFNTLLGGAQVSIQWMKQINPTLYFLIHPEMAFEITSLTSYKEYYLENRFLYSLNLGLIKKLKTNS